MKGRDQMSRIYFAIGEPLMPPCVQAYLLSIKVLRAAMLQACLLYERRMTRTIRSEVMTPLAFSCVDELLDVRILLDSHLIHRSTSLTHS